MSTNEMTSMVRELKELEALAAEAEAQIEAIKDALKTEMNEKNVEEMKIDVWTVRYKAVTSSRIDTAAFKKSMPDIAALYTRETVSRRFTIA